jgi:ribosomal protein L35
MKTNKSFTKRLRVSKRGKIIARAPGQNHFNAKESGSGHMRRHRQVGLAMNQENRSRFLPRSN